MFWELDAHTGAATTTRRPSARALPAAARAASGLLPCLLEHVRARWFDSACEVNLAVSAALAALAASPQPAVRGAVLGLPAPGDGDGDGLVEALAAAAADADRRLTAAVQPIPIPPTPRSLAPRIALERETTPRARVHKERNNAARALRAKGLSLKLDSIKLADDQA
jgi:hypothetical protein